MNDASVAVSSFADLRAIARAAGNEDGRYYAEGRLCVRGVTQAALDAAVAQIGTDPASPPRIVTGERFLALWLPAEIAAAFTADPLLMAGAMKVLAQNAANLDSAECAQLLGLAEAKGCITAARRQRILAGLPPE
jgi:hypothetical protein